MKNPSFISFFYLGIVGVIFCLSVCVPLVVFLAVCFLLFSRSL